MPHRVQAEAQAVSVESLGDVPARAQGAGHLIVATYNVAHGRGGEFDASNWSGGTREEKIRRLEIPRDGIGITPHATRRTDLSSLLSADGTLDLTGTEIASRMALAAVTLAARGPCR